MKTGNNLNIHHLVNEQTIIQNIVEIKKLNKWRHPRSWIGIFDIWCYPILPKVIYKYICLYQNPNGFCKNGEADVKNSYGLARNPG